MILEMGWNHMHFEICLLETNALLDNAEHPALRLPLANAVLCALTALAGSTTTVSRIF